MPLPDHIFTSGQVGFDFMSNAGYPSKNIDIVGGIRFSDIHTYNQNMPNKIKLRNKYDIYLILHTLRMFQSFKIQ